MTGIPPLTFGHGTHGKADRKVRRLKGLMALEAIGGSALIFAAPYIESGVTSRLGVDHDHRPQVEVSAPVPMPPDSSGTVYIIPPAHAEPVSPEPVVKSAKKDEEDEDHKERVRFGVAALLSALFSAFHLGLHGAAGGLFYKFGRHKAVQEVTTRSRSFDGVKSLLRETVENEGDDYVIEENGDRLILRRKPQ